MHNEHLAGERVISSFEAQFTGLGQRSYGWLRQPQRLRLRGVRQGADFRGDNLLSQGFFT